MSSNPIVHPYFVYLLSIFVSAVFVLTSSIMVIGSAATRILITRARQLSEAC